MKIRIDRTRITIPYNGGIIIVDGEGSTTSSGEPDFSVYLNSMIWESPSRGTPVTGEDKKNVMDLIKNGMKEEGIRAEFLGN